MFYAIRYHLHNFKKVKNTHGGVLLLVRLQVKPATLLKVTLVHGCFSRFLNCTSGIKPRKASQILLYNPSMFYRCKFIFISLPSAEYFLPPLRAGWPVPGKSWKKNLSWEVLEKNKFWQKSSKKPKESW